MNTKLTCALVLGLATTMFGCDLAKDDRPSSVTFRVRNSYNGCGSFGDGWCMYVTCPGYDQQKCFPADNTCERQWTFEDVPAEACVFKAGGEYAAQHDVPGGRSCSLFFERISGGGYYGIQPQWIDYGLSCD